MTANIQVVKRDEWPAGYNAQHFRVEDEKGWCEFSIWPFSHYHNSIEPYRERRLTAYGGSTWPFSWPEIFDKNHDGFGNCIGYSLRKEIADAILIAA